MNRKISFMLLLLTAAALVGVPEALAFPGYLDSFNTTYPSAVGTRIDNCLLCHNSLSGGSRNGYGTDFGNNSHNFTAIEPLDSDGDGFTNIVEINNLTFPGNASDFPPTVVPPTPAATFNISGFKINNATGSGIQGWNITVTNATLQKSMLTGADGSYKFTDLVNGTYNVSEEMKSGFTPVGATLQQVTIDGQDFTNVNFTNEPIPGPIPANRTFAADLTGGEEVPPVVTLARGNATFNLSDDGTVLQFKVTVANITNATLSHIHLASAGVNGPVVVNLFTGPTKTGRFDGVLAEGNITQANLIGPLAGQPLSALLDNMTSGNTYVNVHTTQHPAGEIRGQIRVAPAPDARFSISGFKVNNATNSGIQGWNITLRNGTTNALIDSKPTDANGFYQFIVLVNGSYNVSEETKPGFTPVGAMLRSVTIDDSDVTNVNFTNMPSVPQANGSISGFKFNDINGNGTWESVEPGLANWTIVLTMPDGSNITNTTNTDGFYRFSNLSAGNYTIGEVLQPGWVRTFPLVPVRSITLLAGGNVTDIDFGNMQVPQGTFNISGFKINGTDNNGMGIENWDIMLLNATGAQLASTMTDSTGFYNFTGLTNGTYNVTEGMKAGWTNISPMSRMVTINGQDMTNVNFTNQITVTPPPPKETFNISGFKVNDTNGNGVWDTGEMGIENWNIRLLNVTTGTQIASTSTNASGFYQFTKVAPGTYNVTEEMKDGFTPTSATFKIVTVENMDVSDVNFLNHITVAPQPTNTISGFKINDLNGNGKQDAGESGLSGWEIKLTGIGPETASIHEETTTDDQGFYSFENLPPGKYLVVETVKGGYVPSGPPVLVVTLENGMNSMNNNFMNRPVSSLVPDM